MFRKYLILGFLLFPWITFALDATYYADAFEWKRTADGSIFSQNNFSAALCSWVLGNAIYAYSANTGVIVTLNDRPNCNRHAGVIDLSKVAFTTFAPLSAGRIQNISVYETAQGTPKFNKSIFSQNDFSEFSIDLDTPLSNTYFAGESIRLRWKSKDKASQVFVYLENKTTWYSESQVLKTETNGVFDGFISFPGESGEYHFIIASGNRFETTQPRKLHLLPRESITYPKTQEYTKANIRFSVKNQKDDFYVALPSKTFGEISLQSDEKSFVSFGQSPKLSLDASFLGKASYVFTGYTLSTSSSLDRAPISPLVQTWLVILDRAYDSLGQEKVRIQKQKSNLIFRFRLASSDQVLPNYYFTLPDGNVIEYTFPQKYKDADGFLKRNILIQASVPFTQEWTYKLETVSSNWYAYFNIPITKGEVWNTVSLFSSENIRTLKRDRQKVESTVVTSINRLRASLQKSLLIVDPILSQVAQMKAENMSQNDYVWHWTPDWKNIVQFAKNLKINLQGAIAENVAWGNVSDTILQDGLEQSWSHRYTMIDEKYSKIGIGYVLKWEKTYLVQVFGE